MTPATSSSRRARPVTRGRLNPQVSARSWRRPTRTKESDSGFESHLSDSLGVWPLELHCEPSVDVQVAQQETRSSSRLRRSQPVTSALHLLALHDRQTGTMLPS